LLRKIAQAGSCTSGRQFTLGSTAAPSSDIFFIEMTRSFSVSFVGRDIKMVASSPRSDPSEKLTTPHCTAEESGEPHHWQWLPDGMMNEINKLALVWRNFLLSRIYAKNEFVQEKCHHEDVPLLSVKFPPLARFYSRIQQWSQTNFSVCPTWLSHLR
jgi:hypothetical protein